MSPCNTEAVITGSYLKKSSLIFKLQEQKGSAMPSSWKVLIRFFRASPSNGDKSWLSMEVPAPPSLSVTATNVCNKGHIADGNTDSEGHAST